MSRSIQVAGCRPRRILGGDPYWKDGVVQGARHTHVRRARLGAASLTVGLTAVGAVTLTAAPAGAATTIVVDNRNAGCSDSGPGTAQTPLCTIRRAAQIATAGQTVSVATGTYAGDIVPASSGTASAPIAYRPATGATVTIQGGTNGFRVSGRAYVSILQFTIRDTVDTGIQLSSSRNITLVGNRVTGAGTPQSGLTASGIELSGTTGCVLLWNSTDHNSDAGVSLTASSNDNQIVANTSSDNARGYVRAAAGFDLRGSSGNVVSSNRSFGNEDSGFNIWTGTVGTQVVDNVAYRNGDHGIDVHDAITANVVSNTVYGGTDSGIEVTTSVFTTLADNISADNGIDSPRTSGNLRVDVVSAPYTGLDDDLVFLRVAGVMVDWAGVRYSSLAAFRSATGREPHGVQADPRFANATANDFHVAPGSPAIDSANSAASGQPAADADGRSRFDDPATRNTGRGPITYADRGAFEYQR
jgi:parallel beta-helix repeat protein